MRGLYCDGRILFWTNVAAVNKESAYADITRILIALQTDLNVKLLANKFDGLGKKFDDKFDGLNKKLDNNFDTLLEILATTNDAAREAVGKLGKEGNDTGSATKEEEENKEEEGKVETLKKQEQDEEWSERWEQIGDEFHKGVFHVTRNGPRIFKV